MTDRMMPKTEGTPATAFQSGTIRSPHQGERAYVAKVPVVVGEVVVTKRVVVERGEVTGTVRRQRVRIEARRATEAQAATRLAA